MLERFTHPDPAREIALVALAEATTPQGTSDDPVQIGVARCVRTAPGDEGGEQGEFAIVVADAFQGKGLGTLLMRALMEAARSQGLRRIEGLVLATNQRMLDLMSALGFTVHTAPDDPRLRRVARQL